LPPAVAALFLFTGQLIGDGLATVEGIAMISLRQLVTADALLGRVNATVHVLVEGIAPLGALAGAALALAIGDRDTLFVAALGNPALASLTRSLAARIAPRGRDRAAAGA
jgi:hypothetical protein